MKKLYSKKSGFSLIEILVAFMVFAIMSTLVVQVLNLTINRRNENTKYEDYLQGQNHTIIAMGKDMTHVDDAPDDGDLTLAFKDKDDKNMPIDLVYQFKSADGTVNDAGGLNSFVGNMRYDQANGDIPYNPPAIGGGDEADGGSSQMSRFDTRITGTKGIGYVNINCTYVGGNDATGYEYKVTVSASTLGVDSVIAHHAQVSVFFGEGKSGGKMAKIIDLDGIKDPSNPLNQNRLIYVKRAGLSGVNVHCNSSGTISETFTVKFEEKIDNLGFSEGVTGNTYTPIKDDGTTYVNIFGAYKKPE